MRKIGTATVELDSTKIIREDENELVLPGVLAREGVFRYSQGKAFRPAEELKNSLFTFEGAWVVQRQHPETWILTDPALISGRVDQVAWDEQKHEVHGNVHLYKSKTSGDFLANVKSGVLGKNSIGFLYEEDWTKGSFNGQPYDFVQRKILIDHIAVGVPNPRDPGCVLGVDADVFSAGIKIGLDPWEETEEYIRSGHKQPSDACRTIDISGEEGIKAIYCKYGEDWSIQSYLFSKAKGWTEDKAKTWFSEHKAESDAIVRRAIDQEGDLEAKRKEAKDRCSKYPISFKEGKGNLTKPSKYEDVSEDDFADPCNFGYPMIPEERLRSAWQRLHDESNRADGGYSAEEWAWMKGRVKKRLEAKGVEVQADAFCELERSRRLLSEFKVTA